MVDVSVIMPVYNAGKYLKESLDCILNQSLSDLEVICVDDGSSDDSLDIIKDIAATDSRVKYHHQENRGGGAARNVAIKHATGKYIYFMDADDKLDNNALKECFDISEEKHLDFLIFKAIDYVEDTGEYVTSEEYTMSDVCNFVKDKVFSYKDLGDLIFKISVTPWCKFYNREFVVKSNAKFAEGLIFHDNIFFYDSLFYAKRIYFYNKVLYTRRRHSASSTGAGDRRHINYITISEMIWEIFFRHNVFDEYKKDMQTKKFGVVHYWYKHIKEEFKEEYFTEMKVDYEKIAKDDDFCRYIVGDLVDWQKNIFMSVIDSDTHEEFDLHIRNYELERENKHLKELLDSPLHKLIASRL